MRHPDIIRKLIAELREELQASILHHSKELLWEDKYKLSIDKCREDEESIGFFNITKARTILQALYDGDTLLLEHSAGKSLGYKVWMNPQRNRIIVEGDDFINENNIMGFIVWHAGTWYKLNTDL